MFLTNRPSLINRVTPIPGISDHDTIPYIESSIKAKYQRPVRRKIFLWNLHTATGSDTIPGRLLKELTTEITPALTLIFKASLHQGEIPEQ